MQTIAHISEFRTSPSLWYWLNAGCPGTGC